MLNAERDSLIMHTLSHMKRRQNTKTHHYHHRHYHHRGRGREARPCQVQKVTVPREEPRRGQAVPQVPGPGRCRATRLAPSIDPLITNSKDALEAGHLPKPRRAIGWHETVIWVSANERERWVAYLFTGGGDTPCTVHGARLTFYSDSSKRHDYLPAPKYLLSPELQILPRLRLLFYSELKFH